jgi:hypothetical protein
MLHIERRLHPIARQLLASINQRFPHRIARGFIDIDIDKKREGISLRAIVRLTEVSRTTLRKLLVDAGQAFSEYQDRVLTNLPCRRIQVDEAGVFCYAKQNNVPTAKKAPEGAADIWTCVGLDADSKLAVSWHVGDRDSEAAEIFINDLAKRLSNRVQLTSDGHKPYLQAIEGAFGADIDDAMLV